MRERLAPCRIATNSHQWQVEKAISRDVTCGGPPPAGAARTAPTNVVAGEEGVVLAAAAPPRAAAVDASTADASPGDAAFPALPAPAPGAKEGVAPAVRQPPLSRASAAAVSAKGSAPVRDGKDPAPEPTAEKFVYQKPKPQANVMLSDLFDNLLLSKRRSGTPAATAAGGAGRQDGKEGKVLSLTMGHRQVKENCLSGASGPTTSLIGLGGTQFRRKEKAGPKKVRMSSMKKTILRELMMRHGMLPAGRPPVNLVLAGSAAAVGGAAPGVAAADAQPAAPGAGDADKGPGSEEGENEDTGKCGGAEGGLECGSEAEQEELTKALVDAAFAQLYPDEADEEVLALRESEQTLARDEEEAVAVGGQARSGATPGSDFDSKAGAGAGARAKAGASAGAKAETGGKQPLVRPKEAHTDPLLVREYVHQLVSPEVNEATSALLSELQRLQERAHLKDPVKAAMRKRFVCGLREVQRALKANKAKALIVTHNVERISAEDGLDEMMMQLMRLCEHQLEWAYDESSRTSAQHMVPREVAVPIIFAFTRRSLSRALHRSAKASCCAVLSYDGVSEQFKAAVAAAERARRRFAKLSAPWPADRSRSRWLVRMVRTKGGAVQTLVDPLELHAHASAWAQSLD